MQIQLEIAWQPMFGGGVRGLGFFDVLQLPMSDIWTILNWMTQRHKEEAQAFRGKK